LIVFIVTKRSVSRSYDFAKRSDDHPSANQPNFKADEATFSVQLNTNSMPNCKAKPFSFHQSVIAPSHNGVNRKCRLGDGDLASLLLLCLWDHNREDAVLHGSLDVVGVNADWEGEAS